MTDAVQTAMIAAIAPTIAALAALAVGVRNGLKANDNGKKADTIIEKAVEIHTLTNSSLSNVQKALEVANEKISGLEKLVGQMSATKPLSESPPPAK